MNHALEIIGLKVKAKIGVHAWEQQIRQTLVIDISLPLELRAEDEMEAYIDYDRLCQGLTDLMQTLQCKLIETVAQKIFLWIESTFAVCPHFVRVSKPHAVKQAHNIAVTIYSPSSK